MPNWKNIEKLRDHLKFMRETENRKFSMPTFLRILSGKCVGQTVSLKEIRANGPACGSAGCLYGEAVIALYRGDLSFKVQSLHVPGSDGGWVSVLQVPHDRIRILGRKLLGLTVIESEYVYGGDWAHKPITRITKADAVKYLNKALKLRDVMVFI